MKGSQVARVKQEKGSGAYYDVESFSWNSEARAYVCLIALSCHKLVTASPISFVTAGSWSRGMDTIACARL